MQADPVVGMVIIGYIVFGGLTIYLLWDKFTTKKAEDI